MKVKSWRPWIVSSCVGIGFVSLAWMTSRVGPPRSLLLTIAGPDGLLGHAIVSGRSKEELPFTIRVGLKVEPEQLRGKALAPLSHSVPGSEGGLRDGIEGGDGDKPCVYWVQGERDGLQVESAVELEAWAADGRRLRPLALEASPKPGVARLIRMGF